MSPVFSDAERERVRERLLETGYELFSSRGLKKTSLEDLTRPAGIAKTSFYSFFDSKEGLFLELMMRQWPGIEERLYSGLREAEDAGESTETREAISRFMKASVKELETNPLGRRFLTHPEELEMVMRRVGPEEQDFARGNALPIVEFIERGQEEGRIVEGDPEVMAGVMQAVTILSLHEREIGEEMYPKVMEMMIGLIASGLSPEGKAPESIGVERTQESSQKAEEGGGA